MSIAYTRTGASAGAPLMLLHPLGSNRGVWGPIVPALADTFDVIAVDLPGFGDSPPQSDPAPAGLWRRHTPRYVRTSLSATRWMAVRVPGVLSRLVRYRLGRLLVLGQTHGRPLHATPEYARGAIRALGTSPGFDATFAATLNRRYTGGASLDVPIALAFGARDRLLLAHQSRHLDQLPPGTRVGRLPRCGHVPMTDDPHAVAAFIAASTGSDRGSQSVWRNYPPVGGQGLVVG